MRSSNGDPVMESAVRALDRARRALEPVLRRLMHFYWRFTRTVTLGVRALVIDEAGRVFLVKHSYVSGWHLPGGGVEPGETVGSALARELGEEGNIELTETPQLCGLYYNDRDSPRDHVALYLVRGFRQSATPVRGYEIVAHGFFAVDALPNDTSVATRTRIIEVLGGTPPSERW
jgi:8-oxo-dGTP pyrophosphatase MutT (NUDIX family)